MRFSHDLNQIVILNCPSLPLSTSIRNRKFQLRRFVTKCQCLSCCMPA